MSNVIIAKDSNETIPTKQFEYCTFPFEKFNPPQSTILPHITEDVNLVICTATASGKTTIAEMCISYSLLEKERTGMFVGPLKALTSEKYNDWTSANHCFSMFNIEQCSGDYQITQNRIEALDEADIISITPEMLSSRCRNVESEKSKFLYNVGVAIFDEAHLLTCAGRGDGVETAMIQLAQINPDVRFVLLTGTMNNGEEVSEWLSTLNGKKTVLLKSDYRPVPITEEFVTFESKGFFNKKTQKYQPASYKNTENLKTQIAIKEFLKHKDKKHLIFYHTKVSQRNALKSFRDAGINCEIFNADCSKEVRDRLIESFNDPNGVQCLLSTSSLAWGVNLNATRVIIVGVTRGMSDVEVYDLLQMKGRSGRPKYDTSGHCTFIIPKDQANKVKAMLKAGTIVDSTFAVRRNTEPSNADIRFVENTIAFHAIAEVEKGNDNLEKLENWFKGTLAYFQSGKKALARMDNVAKAMVKADLIRDSHDKYNITRLGRIAAQLYYDPFSIVGFHRNMEQLKDGEITDADCAYILSNVHQHVGMFMTDTDEENFDKDVEQAFKYNLIKPSIAKTFFAYYKILQGQTDGYFGAYQSTLMQDAERTCVALRAIDSFYKFGFGKELDILATRLRYGVQKHLASLCLIHNVGAKRATALYSAGIRSYDDFISADYETLHKATGLVNKGIIEEMKDDARNLMRQMA